MLDRLSKSTELRDRLHDNTAFFRREIEALGFTIKTVHTSSGARDVVRRARRTKVCSAYG